MSFFLEKDNHKTFGDRNARIFPNGECVVYRRKIERMKPQEPRRENEEGSWLLSCWKLYLSEPESFRASCLLMGLSLVSNFDKLAKLPENEFPPVEKATRRNGLKGITRQGARTVRCAAHLIQKEAGRAVMTFATVTVPNLPMNLLRVLHENWGKAVELYRLNLRRLLESNGLPGQIVTVSEIQEERHDNTGVPVLHLHSVFVGRKRYQGWVLSPKSHDDIWRRAVEAVTGPVTVSFKSAANLQGVHSDASSYLGKYMTKGAASVKKVVESGFGNWLPRQWWNMSRSLKQWVDRETIDVPEFANFLLDGANGSGREVWLFHGHVSIDIGDSQPYWLATYGRLQPSVAEDIRAWRAA